MANGSKLLSGRVLVTPYNDLTNSRHEFLGLSQAEPNLGTGSDGSILTISTNNQRVFSNVITVSSNTSIATITNLDVTGNTDLGDVGNLTITGGNVGYVLTTDGVGNLSWQEGTSNGVPGGSNTQVQFNNDGVFGGSSSFTFDNSTGAVTVNADLIANSLTIGSGIYQWSTSQVYFATTVTTNSQVLYSVPVDNISGAEFHIIATDATAGIRQTAKISSVVYGNQVQFTEYAGLYVNGEVGVFQVVYDAGNLVNPASLQLKVTPDSTNTTNYKLLITLFAE
jgi:hypothetical protein